MLLETALSAGVVRRDAGRYTLTRVGDNVLHEELTLIIACAAEHGLHLAEAIDGLGICHSLLRFEHAAR